MVCKDQAQLQAYLDGELTRNERKQMALHLEQCPECQALLTEMKELEDWTRINIRESFPHTDSSLVIDGDEAWSRFTGRLETSESQMKQPILIQKQSAKNGRWKHMKKSTKRWISGVAAAGAVLGSLSIPQVQAAASELLSVFRVDQVEFVKLTEKDLESVERFLESKNVGSLDLKGMGKIRIEGDQKEEGVRHFDSYEQAVKSGEALPKIPADAKAVGEVTVQESRTIHFQLDTDKVNKLLHQLNSGVKLDDKLNGKTFSVEVPKQLDLNLISDKGEFQYSITNIPQIQVEKDVDIIKLRQTILSLPFIPENIKSQLVDINDWQHTLPIPVYGERDKVREVQINGVKGIVVQGPTTGWETLIWQKDGKIHSLTNYSDQVKMDQLIEMARKMGK
ncbi:anti-sigma factor [Laceyella putida]|uniref:Anti-sigma-W factor RsiW n=1 Tax=Laceyella putida TaxID=110101 RepID=A0ABW2RGU7_9BACL